MTGEGKTGGFTKQLAERLGKERLVKQHCLAHRLQLIVRGAIMLKENHKLVYPNGVHLEEDLNDLSSFF